MKAIYQKPVVDVVSLNTDSKLLWGEHGLRGGQSANVGAGNESTFFDEDMDGGADPFFDD